jgi:hypothetical protein
LNIWAIPGLFLLLTNATMQRGPADIPTRQASENDIRETVVRYQIQTWKMAAASYCIKINDKDATKDFLERFSSPSVKRASQCKSKRIDPVMTVVVDRATKKQSVIFDIGQPHWVSDHEVEVDGGYFCASQCMAGGTYHLVYEGSHWVVKNYAIHFIA